MQLLVFRHGIAEESSKDGSDAARALTRDGVRKTREAAEGLAAIASRPAVILTSPKLRALQTARILAEVFERPVDTLDELAEGPPQPLLRKLIRRPEEVILIVGHEPTLSRIVLLLCGFDPARGGLELKKAGCACVEYDSASPPGLLRWLATPAMLRALAR